MGFHHLFGRIRSAGDEVSGKITCDERAPDYAVLLCPRCANSYLHHGRIIVFDRGEDQPHTIRTTVAGLSTKSELVASRDCENPSSRRDGLVIEFDCEGCSPSGVSDIKLTIAQHKGETFLAWEYPPRAPDAAA